MLGTNRGFDARLSGSGSCEDQRRCAFLLYRQENISERTPHLLERTVLCRQSVQAAKKKHPLGENRTLAVRFAAGYASLRR